MLATGGKSRTGSSAIGVPVEIRETTPCRFEIERCGYRRLMASPLWPNSAMFPTPPDEGVMRMTRRN